MEGVPLWMGTSVDCYYFHVFFVFDCCRLLRVFLIDVRIIPFYLLRIVRDRCP